MELIKHRCWLAFELFWTGRHYSKFKIRSLFSTYEPRSRSKDWLKVGTNTTLTRSINHRVQTGSINNDGGGLTQSLIGAALHAPPTLKPYNADGSIYQWRDQPYGSFYGELRNPLSGIQTSDITATNTVLSNVYVDFFPVKGLKYRINLSVNTNNSLNDYYFPLSAFSSGEITLPADLVVME